MSFETMDDGQLLQHFAQTRDEAAFTVFYSRRNFELRGFLTTICHVGFEDIDDVVQSVWERIIQKAHLYDPGQSLKNWINNVARSVNTNLWRQSNANHRGGPDFFQRPLDGENHFETTLINDRRIDRSTPDPSARMVHTEERHEQLQQIRAAMEHLTEAQREAIDLVYLEGISTDRVAKRLEISRPMLFKRLSRGRNSLRRILAGTH